MSDSFPSVKVADLSRDEEEPRRFKLTLTAWIGITIFGFWVVVAVLGPWLAPHGESEILSARSFAPAGEVGLLGSDYLGRDVFSRVLYGARMTMGLAFITTIVSFSVGIALGFTAAASGALTDNVLSRINDAIMAFPAIILALMVIASLGTSLVIVVLTVALIDATVSFESRARSPWTSR